VECVGEGYRKDFVPPIVAHISQGNMSWRVRHQF